MKVPPPGFPPAGSPLRRVFRAPAGGQVDLEKRFPRSAVGASKVVLQRRRTTCLDSAFPN